MFQDNDGMDDDSETTSKEFNSFNETDKKYLEKIIKVVEMKLV